MAVHPRSGGRLHQTMSIRSRGNSYIVDVKVRGQRARQHARTKSEARELEARLRAELTGPPRRGLEEALVEYLRSEAKTLRDQKGIKTNARALRPYLSGKTLEEAPQAAADARRDWLADDLKPATINRRLALLRRLLNLCYQWGWTDTMIGPRIKLLAGEVERHVYLSADEVEAIASRMPNAGDMVRLTAYTGLRLGELMGLTAKNITKDAILLWDTKNTEPRVVPVPKRVRRILKQIPWQITETVRRDEWEAARKAAGMPHVRWHDLRHTYASFLAARKFSDREMGALLGHKSPAMVKRYAHLRNQHLAKLVSGL